MADSQSPTNPFSEFASGPIPQYLRRLPPRERLSERATVGMDHWEWSPELEARVCRALTFIPAIDRDIWLRVGMALHSSGAPNAYEIWDGWSRTVLKTHPEKYSEADQLRIWKSFDRPHDGRSISLGTIFHLARERGWTEDCVSDRTSAGPEAGQAAQATTSGDAARRSRREDPNKPEADNSARSKTSPGTGAKQPENDTAPENANAAPSNRESSKGDTAEDRQEIRRLAELGRLEYDREREAAAERLKIRVTTLDKEVEAERGEFNDDDKQGQAMHLPEPEPWPDPVNGADLLRELSAVIRRHIVMFEHLADTAALWVVHTYLLPVFGVSPRLAITSPEKQCGKTTLLDVLFHLVWRPLIAANVSAAAIFRVVESYQPTLLIDEADTFLPENEELRGILNSGHRRGGSVIRTVGEDHEPRAFSTFSACAIAMIGRLPPTLDDRSVRNELRRRRVDEVVEPFRFDHTEHLDQLARKAARWAGDNASVIQRAEPDMPTGVFNRAADNWRPLLAIADAAGAEWPSRARRAVQCTGESAAGDGDSLRVLLLTDIRMIFAERKQDRISSAALVDALNSIEGRPWAEWNRGKGLTPNRLARMLAPFGIAPATVRMRDDTTPKGYLRSQFEDAFVRYLPEEGF
jgi:putative DNA primase/helicase